MTAEFVRQCLVWNDSSLLRWLKTEKLQDVDTTNPTTTNNLLVGLYACAAFNKLDSFEYTVKCLDPNWIIENLSKFKVDPDFNSYVKPISNYSDSLLALNSYQMAKRGHEKLVTHCLLDTVLYPSENSYNSSQLNVYKNLITAYPSLQFVTTSRFLLLPHLYACSLLRESKKLQLVQKISNPDENPLAQQTTPNPSAIDKIVQRFGAHTYHLSPELSLILSKIFDKYAKTSIKYKIDLNPNLATKMETKGKEFECKCMNIDDFKKYIGDFIGSVGYCSDSDMETTNVDIFFFSFDATI